MTIAATGAISASTINTELGRSTTTANSSLSSLNAFIKAPRPTQPNFTSFRNLTYYLKNNAGNCSNGNCTSNCNCGNIQCTNCVISGTVNCVNCDAQSWLQANCNCACTYNCATAQVSHNCDCDCNCNCGG
jgi:hypothetical protein